MPEGQSNFAKRLITGLAAERYFESSFSSLTEFKNFSFENTTRLGCGYDFRLKHEAGENFLAVEVKGLKATSGCLSLTPKEHEVASALDARFFLFVVKNFRDSRTTKYTQTRLRAAFASRGKGRSSSRLPGSPVCSTPPNKNI